MDKIRAQGHIGCEFKDGIIAYMSLFPNGYVEDFEKDNYDPKVIEDFFTGFTFVVHSFGDMDDDMGGLKSIKDFFSK